MVFDEQYFRDLVIAIPSEVKNYTNIAANFVDKQVEQISELVREQLINSPWVPEQLRPPPPPPPPIITPLPTSVYDRAHNWIVKNRYLLGAVFVVSGTLLYQSYRTTQHHRKVRRARRSRNGGRIEVVVIAGSPALPLTKAVALDLERKGFVVFVVCSTVEDEKLVQKLSRHDIRPMNLDITNPPSAGASIDLFAQYLQAHHAPVPGAKPVSLHLKSVLLIPSLNYQTSPIATIPPSSFSDLFNTHLLHPILTIQAFLPLLTSRLSASADKARPKVLVFTPSIISSVSPPFHAPEATVCSALTAFTEVLAGELQPLGIRLTHIQMGSFDFTGFIPAGASGVVSRPLHPRNVNPALLVGPARADTLTWPDTARYTYARNYISHSATAIAICRIRGMRASSLRELHNAVFDAMDDKSGRGGVVRVGLGASIYAIVGSLFPRSVVSWMTGMHPVDELQLWQSPAAARAMTGSRPTSASGEPGDYVAVPFDTAGDADVWK